MLRDIGLVAGKDLRIEARSRVAVNQILPFALLIIVLFAFALSADKLTLERFTPGLFWVTVLLAALLAIQRGVAIETNDGAGQALLLTGMEPAAIFLGKAIALFVQLLLLEVALVALVLVLYGAEPESATGVLLLFATSLVATVGIAAAGTLYGVLASGLGVRETILPVLLLPVLAPVLIGATRGFDDALGIAVGNGWAWLGLLAVFAVSYLVFGSLAYGVLLEDS